MVRSDFRGKAQVVTSYPPRGQSGTEGAGSGGVAGVFGGGRHVVAFELEVETAARETEFACGARDVVFVTRERIDDYAQFQFVERVGERRSGGGGGRGDLAVGGACGLDYRVNVG